MMLPLWLFSVRNPLRPWREIKNLLILLQTLVQKCTGFDIQSFSKTYQSINSDFFTSVFNGGDIRTLHISISSQILLR